MDRPAPTRDAHDPTSGQSGQSDHGEANDTNTSAQISHQDTETPIPSVEEAGTEMNLSQRMEMAKELYPGSRNWARDEERLFEILYLRQDLPMLPSHWTLDFRGFPIPEDIFETSDEYPPIIYAHSKDGSKEFSATASITRLVDLTLSVRTLIESESPGKRREHKVLRRKAANLIKDSLDDFIAWAARDGGYDQLKAVPNIVAEVVDAPETQDDIVQFMVARMRALSQLQREFYRCDRNAEFWSTSEPRIMGSRSRRRSALRSRIRAGIKRRRDVCSSTPELTWDELATASPDTDLTPRRKLDYGFKKRRILKSSPASDIDELAQFEDTKLMESVETRLTEDNLSEMDTEIKTEPDEKPLAAFDPPPRTPPPKTGYRRRPPVVYGLYILGTSVFILTADSSKGGEGYISFHVDVNFADNHQSVWNALTVALVVCSARDELMSRLDDFKPAVITCDSDSDPDV